MFVESLKQRSSIRQLAAAVKEELPLVYDALIGERDEFMARALAEKSTAPSPEPTLSDSRGNVIRIVGVVGMMHMDGIETVLTESQGFKIVNTNCPRKVGESGDDVPPRYGFEIPIVS